ncbi:MAG: SCO family protein [Planctomycetota bacterium]|nr:MAG: SCO family protein [Planctomycetota bacterium]
MWTSPITWALLFLGAVFAFAIGANWQHDQRGTPVPAFTLVDSQGEVVDQTQLQNATTLLYFGFTFCPDVCPSSLRSIADALNLLGADSNGVQVWFVSVDPERDTPEVLQEYVELIDPRVRAMSGDAAQLRRVQDIFSIVAERTFPAGGADDYYLINHTASTMLVNHRAELVDRIPQDASPTQFAERIRRHHRPR